MPTAPAVTKEDNLSGILTASRDFRKVYGRDPKDLDELTNPPPKPKVKSKVMLYSVYPSLFLNIQVGYKVTIPLENGKFREVPDGRHKRLQFNRHVAWVEPDMMETIRQIQGYGITFVEALPCGDGDSAAESLSGWLDANSRRGDDFLAQLEKRGKESMQRPVLEPRMVRENLKLLKEGKIQPPK